LRAFARNRRLSALRIAFCFNGSRGSSASLRFVDGKTVGWGAHRLPSEICGGGAGDGRPQFVVGDASEASYDFVGQVARGRNRPGDSTLRWTLDRWDRPDAKPELSSLHAAL
jgi:hypothetical protein